MAGGYEYSFVSPPDDLVCMVCHHVAKEAHQVECCGKVFCKTCIMEVSERVGTCPNCNKYSPKIFSDHRSSRHVKRLKVACENFDEEMGCVWSGTLESCETHEEECGFKEVKCPNIGCSQVILRRFLEEHVSSTCPRRGVKCTICDEMVALDDMPSHPNVCPKVEIECINSGCSVRIFREQLTAHQCVCLKQIIPCPYDEAGCSAQILREDKQKHLLENVERHSTIAKGTVLSLRKELADVNKVLKEALGLPPVTFKMPNYSQMKRKSRQWESPCFYTHIGGYKMRLTVKVNPQDSNYKDHLSVHCHLVPGYNDDHLSWPFAGEVIIQILNQVQDSGHYSCTFDWNGADKRSTKNPSKAGGNTGWGFDAFITYAELENEDNSYLKDNCVYFHILKASVGKPWLTCSVKSASV